MRPRGTPQLLVLLLLAIVGCSRQEYQWVYYGLQEYTRRVNELAVSVYRPLEIYLVLVAEYLLLILLASWMVRRLEDRFRVIN